MREPSFCRKGFGSKRSLTNATFLVTVLLIFSIEPVLILRPLSGSQGVIPIAQNLPSHSPIVIVGNTGFSPANGVTGGSGGPSDPYLVSGWQIDASSVNGITIVNSTSYFAIRGVIILSGLRGIYLDNATNGIVLDSTISNSVVGIQTDHSTNISISGNTIVGGSGQGEAIDLENSIKISVTGNSISANSRINLPGMVVHYSPDSNVSNNTIRYRGNGVSITYSARVVVSGNNISYNQGIGVILDTSPFADISKNFLSYDAAGVSLKTDSNGQPSNTSPNASITKNIVSWNSGDGITVVDNATVNENTVSANEGFGIHVWGDNATISNNSISFNGLGGVTNRDQSVLAVGNRAVIDNNAFVDDGLILSPVFSPRSHAVKITAQNTVNGKPLDFHEGCSNLDINGTSTGQLIIMNCTSVRVSNLIISYTAVGIELLNASNVFIAKNSLNSNTQAGLYVVSSSNVTIVRNNLSNNNRAGIIEYASGTLAYHNNFFSDSAFPCCLGDITRTWDNGYPSGGNYWSDAKLVDNCSGPAQNVCPLPDGIGDSQVYLGIYGEADHYPLMTPLLTTTDMSPPIWLANEQLHVTNTTQTTTTLYWIAATDDVAVISYQLYQGSTLVATIPPSPFNESYLPVPSYTYTIRNLSPGTTYDFRIVAVDEAGNHSTGLSANVSTRQQSWWIQYWYLLALAIGGAIAIVVVFLRLGLQKKPEARPAESNTKPSLIIQQVKASLALLEQRLVKTC